MSTIDYSFEDFLAYVMIFAAHADMEIRPEEKALIVERTDQATYDRMKALFDQHNDAEAIEFLVQMREQLVTTQGNEAILDALRDVFTSDGDFSNLERETLNLIDKITR